MNMKFRFVCFFLLPFLALHAQQVDTTSSVRRVPVNYELPDPKPFVETIRPEDLKELVETLASAEMAGRETGEPGQRKAAEFIAGHFKAAGLPAKADRNSYQQKVSLQKEGWTTVAMKVGEQEFQNRTDFYVFPAYNSDQPMLNFKEVVFVGYGIDDPKYSDYGDTDVKGKAVIFYDGEPLALDGRSLITGTSFRSAWSLDWKRKVQTARQKGATMAIIIDPQLAENIKKNRRLISTYGWKPRAAEMAGRADQPFISNVFVSPDVAKAIFGKKGEKANNAFLNLRSGEKFKPVKLKTKLQVQLDKETVFLEGSNVIGVIEGTDERLKDEYVFVTAHYDHLGQVDNVIYYGADDNGSGTAAVIEIAKAFAEAKKKGVGPKRTVVCMLVSGEEKGLLGSKFYVDFPIFPLERTVADVNIDMIGRTDDLHPGNPDYVYVIGANRISNDLHAINERANTTYTKLQLDYKYDDPNDPNKYYERSDHYNFAERGIPAIFYFNGTHPDYHRPTDTPDKIDYNALTKRAHLAFYTTWDIANRPNRLSIDRRPEKAKQD
jgi:hypothetical protein